MGLLAVLIGGWLGWLMWTGRIGRPRNGQIAALILALVGGAVAARGNVVIGGGMAAAGLLWLSRKPRPATGSAGTIVAPPSADIRAALDLLGLPTDADRIAVIDAHRRLIARNHPDAGGTEALARSINAARDTLLARPPAA
ncbi:MAG: molecular chaperone DnaJ [Sphingobium sp.]